MNIVEIIKKKRDKQHLTKDEVEFFVFGCVDGSIHHSQIGAMLMAMYLNNLDDDEVFHLTNTYVKSGETLDWPLEWLDSMVDKHSTGGFGDKISIILVPVIAACGLKIPMLSGRGLGLTGGTLDKLESIPGFRSVCTREMLIENLEKVGCFIAGTSDVFVPGDKITYAIRDITGTVFSDGLSEASILSKKIVGGSKKLVFDIKFGEGTSRKSVDDAKKYAKNMEKLVRNFGYEVKFVLSRTDFPIGLTIGNALEIAESIECLKGNCHTYIRELVTTIGCNMLKLCGKSVGVEAMIENVITSGCALRVFEDMMKSQGVDKAVAEELCRGNMWNVLPKASHITSFYTKSEGWIEKIHAASLAKVSLLLGSGRKSTNDKIDAAVGIELRKHVADKVEISECWLKVHHTSETIDLELIKIIENSIQISNTKIVTPKIVELVL